MSPWLWFDGITAADAGSAVFAQAAVLGILNWLRHRPDTMTSGMLAPAGALISVKLPSTRVSVLISGAPDGGVPTTGQLTPGVNGSTGAFGM
jgi:hypothetical protein